MWQEASFECHSLNLLLTEREKEVITERNRKNGEFIEQREIFSEPVNREIAEWSGTHTHTRTLSGHRTLRLF